MGNQAPEGAEVVGYPYWDSVPANKDDAEHLQDWFDSSSEAPVLVTLGSFLGLRQHKVWHEIANTVDRLGIRAAFVGVDKRWAMDAFSDRPNLCCVGFVPLSPFFRQAAAIIHHGGLGTTIGTLGSGTPAVVLPQAFDQPFNARLVEAAGVGRDALGGDLPSCIADVLGDRAYRERSEVLATQLVDPTVAANRVAAQAIAIAEQ